jgi:hypothetical protein
MSTPTTIRLTSTAADLSPTTASLHGLDGVNFFLAGVLAGFGPYVAVYLADQKWTQEKIGFVLSASALAGLLSQVPGGELLDTIRSKRAIVALGVLVVALSAMIIVFQSTFSLVLIGLTLQGITGGILGPAIAAISLGVVGHSALPETAWAQSALCSDRKSCCSCTHGPGRICLLVSGDIPAGRRTYSAFVCCSRSNPSSRYSLRSLLRSSSSPHA